MSFFMIEFGYRQIYNKNYSYFKVLAMVTVLSGFHVEGIKNAIQNEAARHQTMTAELIYAEMLFCMSRNIEKSISIITDVIKPEIAGVEHGMPKGD
jgi:hypothetical protein